MVGIVHCFSFFFFRLCCVFMTAPSNRSAGASCSRWRVKPGSACGGEGVGSFISPWWGFFPLPSQALGTGSWSGSLAMMLDIWSDCSSVYMLVHKQPFALSSWLPACLGWFSWWAPLYWTDGLVTDRLPNFGKSVLHCQVVCVHVLHLVPSLSKVQTGWAEGWNGGCSAVFILCYHENATMSSIKMLEVDL